MVDVRRADEVRHPERIEAVLRLARESGCGRVFFRNVYPDVSVFWPAPVSRGVSPGGTRCHMPWDLFVVDTEGNLGLCSAHASCTGRNLYDLPVEAGMNTGW